MFASLKAAAWTKTNAWKLILIITSAIAVSKEFMIVRCIANLLAIFKTF